MQSANIFDDILAARALSDVDAAAVLEHAGALQNAQTRSDLRLLLRGKVFGLMCRSDLSADAVLFRRAVVALGGQVSWIQILVEDRADGEQITATARVLSRLYDAVECQDVSRALVLRLGIAASIPIFPGLACSDHPCARLAERVPGGASAEEKHRATLQAILLRTVG